MTKIHKFKFKKLKIKCYSKINKLKRETAHIVGERIIFPTQVIKG